MTSHSGYQRLDNVSSSSTVLPMHPPEYDDVHTPMEQFEIDDPQLPASGLLVKFANNFNTRILRPVTRIIDPIYEGYKYFQMQFYDIDKVGESITHFIDPKEMKEHLEYFSSIPHITGTKGDLALAKYVQSFFKNNGLHHVELNELESFTNYPDKTKTYLKVEDFEATLFEQHNEGMEFLAFNPNSLNTETPIKGSFIYVNYGEAEDYDKVIANGVEVKDKIVLVKYGGKTPEPNKVYIAEQHKAKAVVFITKKYSVSDDVIQRENVGLTRMSPGDILTPGWASENMYVTRLTWDKSETTPKIPTIPVSWKDGEILLRKLAGGVDFDGYKSGDGKSPALELSVQNIDRPMHQVWNVAGSIEGREQNEKGVIIGAARDSGCYGTMGSNTGTVALLEMVKIFTSMQRKYSWTPSRSIFFVSFDATEYNLAGAAEWIENRKESLRKEGYVYIDLSDLVAGDKLLINANPFLHEVIGNCLQKVKAGDSTMYDLTKNYVPFINYINIPSMEIKFTGVDYPKNSCFDNFDNFETSGVDPKMVKHAQMVELLSRIALEFAESPLIPYNFRDFTRELELFEQDLERYAEVQVEKSVSENYQEWAREWKQFIHESGGMEPTIHTMSRWRWNDNMVEFNGQFLTREIQHQRAGYKNILFGLPFIAPTSKGEFDWHSFPFIRNYISQHDFESAQNAINQLASVLESAALNYRDLS
ncbi:Transferrin receptor-like dimerization domain family protein [Candida albicans]|uniref:Transferrin receptor-like dimerization domain family protein n=1 Tax=Candida albicans TaxID=5476 RepID=A0A8H6C1C8_CANAX|nr:Transferrin receptor-like dimerization domain family protein [Candida albicans]